MITQINKKDYTDVICVIGSTIGVITQPWQHAENFSKGEFWPEQV